MFGVSRMRKWLGQYGGYLLIAAGWLLLSGLIPSAAGPADALRETGHVAPPVTTTAGEPAAPRLIARPNETLLERLAERVAQPTPSPAPSATAQPTSQPTPEPTPPPQATPAPPEVVLPRLAATDRVVIPRIGVDSKVIDVGVLPSGEMDTAAFAVGRLYSSAQAGDPGNAVLAGHNDVEGEVFRRLAELRPGDVIILYRGETAFRYRVQLRTVVREDGATMAQRLENARWMDPTDGPTCTLISCYPYRVDTHRVIVRGQLIEE
jgi:sortase A